MNLRNAREADLSQLLDLEEKSFPGDRISGRSWQALIASRSAVVLVAARGRSIIGAAVLLTRKGTRVGRLYSIAVADAARGAGTGRALVARLSKCAKALGCIEMRLESRADNLAAHRLFGALGFAQSGPVREAYYDDGMGAILFRKRLVSGPPGLTRNV